jgi:adenosylhomocysteinase
MKDGAVLANAGHFDVEIDLEALHAAATGGVREARPLVDEYDLGGRRLYLLAKGRVVNLAAAEGHPAAVMDVSFALQALGAAWLAAAPREAGVHPVPSAIDREVASLKLASLGIEIDALTDDQRRYQAGWNAGPAPSAPRAPSAG